MSTALQFFRSPVEAVHSREILAAIAAQAPEADRTRTISPDVIQAIKHDTPLLALGASKEIGGLEASMAQIAAELEAVAAACGSTAWCLWNHLSVSHLICGCLGPDHAELLQGIVDRHEWVSFPGGAGTRVLGRVDGDDFVLSGPSAFGSGARYGDWLGVAFGVDVGDGTIGSEPDLRITVVRSADPAITIDPTWDGMSVRASATDDVHYNAVRVPASQTAPWFGVNRAGRLRDPSLPVINDRYREDWVGVGDLWLAAQGVGIASACFDECIDGIRDRRAIIGLKMAEKPSIHVNLGQAASLISSARAAVRVGCDDIDGRIDRGVMPTETDELRAMAHASAAIQHCDDAMRLILRVLGGNGLREGDSFERRYRDFQAMPVHINAHQDRINENLGRHLLDLETLKF